MVFLILKGRLGNQLFEYAFVRMLCEELGTDTKIIIDESEVLEQKWPNSLRAYPISNVEYVQDRRMLKTRGFIIQYLALCFYYEFIFKREYRTKYNLEKIFEPLLNRLGLIAIENGYLPYKINKRRNVLVYGFFQTELYFERISTQLKKELDLTEALKESNYPELEQIVKRNTVCISLRVENNVDMPMYNVCTREYWEKGIQYIIEHVENPLFFICSDNVEYVKKHFIDCSKYDTICQAKDFPPHLSLAAMSMCKHYIIGNTSFGWWAQYLSKHEEKIVVAPKKWINVDMPIDIYSGQDSWVLI